MLQARRERLEEDNGRHETAPGADARQIQEPRPNRP